MECRRSSPQTLSLVNKDSQTDSRAFCLVGRDAWERISGDNFPKEQPNSLKAILRSKITPKIIENSSVNFNKNCINLKTFYPCYGKYSVPGLLT